MTQLMTVQQVAEYLQMSNDKIYDMAQKGEIPAPKIPATMVQQRRYRLLAQELFRDLKPKKIQREEKRS